MVGRKRGQRLTVVRIDRNRAFQQRLRGETVGTRHPPVMRQRPHHQVPRVHAVGWLAPAAKVLRGVNLRLDRSDDGVGDLVLHGENVGEVAVVTLRPDMTARCGVVELRSDAYAIAAPSHTAFEHVAHPELGSDLLYLDRLALVGERRVARDHEEPAQFRESGYDVFADFFGVILLLKVAAHIVDRQYRYCRPG